GGMKGITYTQVAQYCVLIFAYLVPAIFISILMTNNPNPIFGFGDTLVGSSEYLLDKLDRVSTDLGFGAYTEFQRSKIDIFCITAALMAGTAGLPHVIVRFFTVPKISDARKSAGYALLFIAILYLTAPAVASFARLNLIDSIQDKTYQETPDWFKNWESIGLIAWQDKNLDGKITYASGDAFIPQKPQYVSREEANEPRPLSNKPNSNSSNEVYIDRDIVVLANPEIAGLPGWVIALIAAGGLAAALSTAAGLLLVISAAISHDLMKKILRPKITEKEELFYARAAATVAIVIAGLFGIYPPAFVAQVVALAFGLAAATLFPVLVLGIFTKWVTREGAISGMLAGLIFTLAYIIWFKFINPDINTLDNWLFGISPEGIGVIGMLINFIITSLVSTQSIRPPAEVRILVDNLRSPES
ncbi:MAG: VC_2705 family sodium/solute symporter, partial [Proteobacteria bacterium]|nr:VC_2705 family sodium/solute symporter [Pseudomonadota bacterium]